MVREMNKKKFLYNFRSINFNINIKSAHYLPPTMHWKNTVSPTTTLTSCGAAITSLGGESILPAGGGNEAREGGGEGGRERR